MADEQAGSVFVKVIPDADRTAFQTEIGKALEGVNATLRVALSVGKGEVTELIAEVDAEFAKRKKRPVLTVDLKVGKGEAAKAIREANANFKKLKSPPQLSVGLNVTATAAKAAIRDANQKLKAAKVAPPKLIVQLDLDERELALVREARVSISKISATLPPIELPVTLDEKTLAKISAQAQAAAATVQARIDAAHANSVKNAEVIEAAAFARTVGNLKARNAVLDAITEEHDAKLLAARLSREAGADARIAEAAAKSQIGLRQKIAAGQDAASLENIRQINRVALAHERAELTKRTSSNVTLRQLRNDLSQFDASTTRVLRNLTLGFGVFTAGVALAFAGIVVASLRSFAQTEQQLRRTAAVLGTDVFSKIAANGGTAEQAFAGFRKEVDRTNEALAGTVNSVAIGTIFDPTEIATGTRALAQAGLEVGQIKSSLLGVAQFAQNEEILPVDAVNSLVQGATAAGESLGDLTSLADKFTFVANNTTASAKEVADAFANRAAPQFRSLGQDIESTLTVLDLFAAAGIKGKTAGEQTGILIRFVNQAAAKNTEVFKKYGIEVGKVNGKQVPFLKTLAQLSTLLDKVGKSGGSIKRTNLQAELGLTQKSAAGLNQILSQVTEGTGDNADKAVKKLFNLRGQIEKATGATQRQASVLLDTLSFQTDILSNNITTLFKQAAGPLGHALTDVFSGLNGEVKIVNGQVTQVGGVLDDLGKKFTSTGQKIADVIAPAIKNFAAGGEGKDFFSGLYDGFRFTLTGIVEGFKVFRAEAFGEGSGKGFFTILGDAFAGIGRFAAQALPEIGKRLGEIVGFIRDNSTEVRLFLKAWLGLFLVSKALRLFLIPVVGLTDNIGFLTGGFKKLLALQISQQLISASGAMGLLSKSTQGAAAASTALAAAEARQVAAQAAARATAGAGGFKAFSSKATAVTAGADVARLSGSAAAAEKAASGFARLGRFAVILRGSLGLLAKATIVIPIALGVVKGVVDQLNASFGGDGNVSLRTFTDGIKAVGHVLASIIKPIFTVLNFLTKMLFIFGQIVGASVVILLVAVVKSIGAAFVYAGQKIGDFIGWIGKLLLKIPGAKTAMDGLGKAADGVGNFFKGGADKVGVSVDFIGRHARSLAQAQREVYGETNALSPIFDRLGESIDHSDAKLAKNIATNKRHQEATAKAAKAAAAAAKTEFDATSVLGVANNNILPSYIRLTAAQRAQRLQVADAARFATNYQQRQANLAFVTDVLTGKVKNQAAMNRILAASSNVASDNLVNLLGGQDKLKGQLDLIAQGNKKAARSYLQSAVAAAYAAKAVTLARANAANEQIAIIRSSARGIPSAALTNTLLAQSKAGQNAKASLKGFVAEQQALVKELLSSQNIPELADEKLLAGISDGEDAKAEKTKKAAKKKAAAHKEVKTAAELAEIAVNKLSLAEFRNAADNIVSKISRLGANYHASAFEANVLAKAIPAVDAALQKQTDYVTKLDDALSKLKETQLAGTKAFSDQAFALDQQQKALELQKVNLQIATPGIKPEDPALKALDDQIAAIQLQSQKVDLEQALKLDPLKKKLDETFSPTAELGFDAIIAKFTALTAAKTKADAAVLKTEGLKAKLDAVAAAAADKFSAVGLNVTKGINAGLAAGQKGLVESSKKAATTVTATVKGALGIASPSKVMAGIGADTILGFNLGMASQKATITNTADVMATAVRAVFAADQFYIAAGEKVMRGFKTGLNNEYVGKNGVQAFVKEIAVWIKANKGPISYDAQLLRPAGEAMMSGFHGGLADGFSEIKSWVKKVGPSIASDAFPKELMFQRSARFLINNARADATFNPDDAFGDLVPDFLGGAMGGFDPTLSFLHKTLSVKDTEQMARKLLALYPSMNLGALMNDHSKFVAGTDRISDHAKGIAADLGTGGPQPTKDSLALFAKLKPLLGTVFKQLIHNGLGLNADGGTFPLGGHQDHIHASWLPGEGFSVNSGKIGVGALNIPGVPADVLNAITVASQKFNMDPALIAAVMKKESTFRKNIVSPDHGYGLMQLTSPNLISAADKLGGRLDPVANALVGTKYLRDLISQLGSLKLGLSAYNSGPGGGERQGHIDVPAYVNKVLEYLTEIRRQTGGARKAGNRAQGGRVKAGAIYGVNERGREVWAPEKNGSVITNKNVEAMIEAMRSGQLPQQAQPQQVYAPQISVASNSPDPSVVAALVDARMRAQVTGVRR